MHDESIFAGALSRAPGPERRAFLDRACGRDDALRRRIERLLEADGQALALMDHPNIAKVLDASEAEGRPYFVMELIKGAPITDYCDRAKLSPRKRLALFVPVREAVQHAHQKGAVHRDLKPSNILVALYDPGKLGVPKVIDFGIAKAAGARLTDRSIYTEVGALVGTLEYMAPEQAELNAGSFAVHEALHAVGADDWDAAVHEPGAGRVERAGCGLRSDVYSLSVLLYELLTATTPFDRQRLATSSFDELRRIIKEEEPPKPSTRLSRARDEAKTASARQTEPAKLAKLVRGELDRIVMKALERDRGRRYQTANGFARDVQRYLADEPVEACPPSAKYRLGKLPRRHRTAAIAGGLVLLALLVGIAGTTYGLIRAQKARAAEARRAEGERVARLDAVEERRKAIAQRDKAMAAEAKSQAINAFLTEDLLTRAEPANNAAEDHVELLVVLDRAAAKVGRRFAGQPDLEAALRGTLARTYHGLSLQFAGSGGS
jgi:hypothetical protein